MKNRLIAILLVVLTLFGAMIIPVTAAEPDPAPAVEKDYKVATKAALTNNYATVKAKLTAEIAAGYTELYAQTDKYQLFCNQYTGEVYLRDRTTGQYLTTNPIDVKGASKEDRLSQVWMTFKTYETGAVDKKYTSFEMAAKKGQITVSRIKGGLRVEYTMGDATSRYLAPQAVLNSDFMETIILPYEERILDFMNYEYITTRFSTFVDTTDPKAEEVYRKMDGLEINEDIGAFYDQMNKVLGNYSSRAEDKYKYQSVCSIFYNQYKAKKTEVEKTIKNKTGAEKEAALVLQSQMLDQIRILVPSATDQLPPDTAVGVNFKAIYEDFGNLNAYYGGGSNLIDLNDLLKDPEKNAGLIETYQNTYSILKETPEDGVYPLIRKLEFTRPKDGDQNATDTLVSRFLNVQNFISKSVPSYTLSMMLEQEDKVGFSAYVIDNPLFRCALEYTIDDTGVTVDIPASSIVFDEGKYQLTELSFLRYFCAGESTQDGYIFYPDGCGALIYNQTMRTSTTINQQIYGYDYAFANLSLSDTSVNSSLPIRMPVFGAVNTVEDKQVGYFAIITEGDSLARLVAKHLDADGAFVGAYASYTLRPTDSYSLGRRTSGSIAVSADFKYTGCFTQKYVMLTDKTLNPVDKPDYGYGASYVGMAEAYRDYLFGTGALTALDEAELEDRLPLFIESYATVKTTESVLSFPVDVDKPLTSFKDVQTIGNELREAGIGNIKFRLIGYYNDGYKGYYPNRVKWMKEVGGKKGFKALMNYVSEHEEDGFEAFTDVDLLYNYRVGKIGGISRKKNGVRSMANRYVTKYTYSTIYRKTTDNKGLLISASRLSKLFAKFDKKFSKFKSTSIALANLASDLSSNYNEKDYFTREQAKTMIAEMMETASGKYTVMATGGNVYAIPYIDYLLEAPVDGSHYNDVSRTVPFFGMVMHGALQYAGSVFNEAGNPEYELLRDIESGAALYVILAYENTDLMKEDPDDELTKHYAANYQIWREDLIDYYDVLDYAIGDLQSWRIVDHRFLSGERTIEDWEREEDARTLENEYLAILERQYDKEIKLRNKLISQLWYVDIPTAPTDEEISDLIKENAVRMLKGDFSAASQQLIITVIDQLLAADDTEINNDWDDAKKFTTRKPKAEAALKKLIDDTDPAYDATLVSSIIADPDRFRKLELAMAMESGEYGVEPQTRIRSVIEAITPGYAAGTDPVLIEIDALDKINTPGDPDSYEIVIGETKVRVEIDAAAIKADAADVLNATISDELSAKIDEFAAKYASAEGIMTLSINGVTDYANETKYSFITDSKADDAAYKTTSYTIGDGAIVLVTYSNGTDTVRFLLNYSIFKVKVELGDRTYTLDKYDFVRLDPRADGKTDPREQ